MERADLIFVMLHHFGISFVRLFTLTFLLLFQGFHDFLSHGSDFRLENWLEASHECLEEGIVQHLFTQMEDIFEH